ncbi:hypothetical protein ACVIGB_000106 [Bradyrhizobium sp. USDA 4341]
MSIVIHGGIVFPDTSLGRVYDLLEGFAPRIAELSADELATFLANHACRKLDAACAGGPDDGRAPLSSAWDEIDRGRKADREGVRHPLTDFEFRVDLFPVGSNVYGVVRTERGRWLKIFLEELSPWVREYVYWDNTDRPDDILAAEWKSRGKVWDRISRTMIRGRISGGCKVDLSRLLNPPESDQIMAKLPDLAARIERTAKDRGVEHFFRHKAGLSDGEHIDDHVRAVLRAPDWLKSTAGQAWLAEERKRLGEVLVSEVRFEDLRRPPPAPVAGPFP